MNRLSTFTSFLYVNNIGSVYRTKLITIILMFLSPAISMGLFGLCPNLTLPKKLVMPNILLPLWFVANYVSAYWPLIEPSVIPARILTAHGRQNPEPKSWLANISSAAAGTIQTQPMCLHPDTGVDFPLWISGIKFQSKGSSLWKMAMVPPL